MKPSAVVMALLGILLLYGGMACCIGIAWYHSRLLALEKAREDELDPDGPDRPADA